MDLKNVSLTVFSTYFWDLSNSQQWWLSTVSKVGRKFKGCFNMLMLLYIFKRFVILIYSTAMEWLITVYRKKLEPEFSVLIISGKLRKHACFKKKFTDQREFNQNMCRWFLKDKIKILNSFCSSLIKIRAFWDSPEHRCNWERGLGRKFI